MDGIGGTAGYGWTALAPFPRRNLVPLSRADPHLRRISRTRFKTGTLDQLPGSSVGIGWILDPVHGPFCTTIFWRHGLDALPDFLGFQPGRNMGDQIVSRGNLVVYCVDCHRSLSIDVTFATGLLAARHRLSLCDGMVGNEPLLLSFPLSL